MYEEFNDLLSLPHELGEDRWLKDRLETLSVKESYILAAAIQRLQPETAAEAINMMTNLDIYEVYYPAASYRQLADWYLFESPAETSDEIKERMDMTALSAMFEKHHPGVFIGGCYIAYPSRPEPKPYEGMGFEKCKDVGASVRLRLASEACPEGVWIRLPDHENMFGAHSGKPDEIALALRELKTASVLECRLLDAQCGVLLPTVNLAEQYESIEELISDGNELGYLIEAAGAEMANFASSVQARTEFGGRQTLKAALEVARALANHAITTAKRQEKADFPALRTKDGRISADPYREEILRLPHTADEGKWIRERFDTLSAKESIILAAAMQQRRPETAIDAINLLIDLQDYEVYTPAFSYEHLADFYLSERGIELPDAVMDFTDMRRLGEIFENQHPGLFIGGYYVAYPKQSSRQLYNGKNIECCRDKSWSIKLKLGSKSCPEGIWLRLPDYSEFSNGRPDEIGIALQELCEDFATGCTLQNAICIFPEAGNLPEQYNNDVVDLIHDGQDLGLFLNLRSRGDGYFNERFAAAVAFEDCRTLKAVLAVAKNLGHYDFVPESEMVAAATEELLKQNIPPELIDSSTIDLPEYADSLLRDQGYAQMESGIYIRRAGDHPLLEQGAEARQELRM